MNLKKNNFSYFAWLVLLFFTGASCAFFGLVLAQKSNMNVLLIAACLVTLFFIVVFGLYLLIGYFLEQKEQKPDILQVLNLSQKLEWIFIISFLVLGFIIRVLMLEHAGEEAAYFEVCKITDRGGLDIQPVQGSVYFYCLLLHGLFYVFGNQWIAGIWLQIILQIIGAFIIVLGLKKLIKRIPAYLVYSFILFAPQSIKAGITYGPQILYFCIFSVVFYVLADYIQRSQQEEDKKAFMWLYTIISSALIGMCIYLDISGLVLLFLWCVLPMVKRKDDTTIWNYRWIIGLMTILLSLLFYLFVDALMSNTTLGSIIYANSILYGNINFQLEVLVNRLNVEFILLILLSCVGCFSFWRRANTEIFTPFILMAISMAFLVFGGITTANMSGTYLMHLLMSMLSAVSITELFCTEDLERERREMNKETKEVEEDKVKEIEFIENPLPVPKKHVRKTMDYAFIPDESKMKYDIQVKDNDDYDLKI